MDINILLCIVAVPSAPEGVSTEVNGKDTMNVSWRKPNSDGGSPIIDYIIEKQEATKSTWDRIASVTAGVTSYTANYLLPDKQYRFRVIARNKVGHSEPGYGPSVIMKSPYDGRFKFILL